MNSNETKCLLEDKNQSEIRNELSKMSFEELQTLKEKIGVKAYNATMFSNQQKSKKPSSKSFRTTKNGPIEMSSKKPVSRFRQVVPVKKKEVRDPRRDNLCGTFSKEAFKNAYSFLTKIQMNDIKLLKEELKVTEDTEKRNKIKFLIQRLNNQVRAHEQFEVEKEKKLQEKKEIVEALKSGIKPVIMKKSEKKILDLVNQYEDLRNTGKLKKHINRIRKKNAHKDRKSLLK